MILHNDHIIQLEYEPAQDILITSLQAVRSYDADEVRKAFITISTYVREYHISRLLLDFSHNTLDLSKSDYKTTIAQLTVGLLQTQLEKVARISSPDAIREHKIETTFDDIKESVTVPIEVRMFATKEEAIHWLLGK